MNTIETGTDTRTGQDRRRVVLATGNRGKLRELQALLGTAYELVPQSDLGVIDIEETGTTFTENALLKARHAAATTGLPAIADDSGLEVDALDGAPGVRSARYAGVAATDADNNAKLLRALDGLPAAARTARFRSVIVYVAAADDPEPLIAEGVWAGRILDAPRGAGGFGYDPLFFDGAAGGTGAELEPAAKNRVSHRGHAARQLGALLTERGR